MLSRPIASFATTAALRGSSRTRNVIFNSMKSTKLFRFHSSIPSLHRNDNNSTPLHVELVDALKQDISGGGFTNQKPLSDFELSDRLVRNLEDAGITHLFPVQVESFSVMMDGKDIMGRSKTGSGKTLAFALPIAQRLLVSPSRGIEPRAVIMLPTRELAQQVASEFQRIAPQLRTALVVGGVSYTIQEAQLRRGVDVLVGTPGRVADWMNKGELDLSQVEVSVLDEADMMLKFGFQEEVETILGAMPEEKQCVMWSATVPKWVHSLARQYLRSPVSIDLVGDDDQKLPSTVAHKAIVVTRDTKYHVLESVIKLYAKEGQALIFTETKQEADDLVAFLSSKIKGTRALHGDLSQAMRMSTMNGFRDGSVRTLICTDIAARGLDIASVDLVIQYRLSNDKESFVHRAGRTGRAGRSGTNIVLFEPRDLRDVQELQKQFGVTFTHVAPPPPAQLVDHALQSVHLKLGEVHPESRNAFSASARALLASEDDGGVDVLSSAMALLAGFESRHPTAYSMLTGLPHSETIVFDHTCDFDPDKIVSWLATSRVKVSFRNIVRGPGSTSSHYYVDVPSKIVPQLIQRAEAEALQVRVVEELPQITMPGSAHHHHHHRGFASSGSRFASHRGGHNGGSGSHWSSHRTSNRFDHNSNMSSHRERAGRFDSSRDKPRSTNRSSRSSTSSSPSSFRGGSNSNFRDFDRRYSNDKGRSFSNRESKKWT